MMKTSLSYFPYLKMHKPTLCAALLSNRVVSIRGESIFLMEKCLIVAILAQGTNRGDALCAALFIYIFNAKKSLTFSVERNPQYIPNTDSYTAKRLRTV